MVGISARSKSHKGNLVLLNSCRDCLFFRLILVEIRLGPSSVPRLQPAGSHSAVQDRILQYKIVFCSTRSPSAVQDRILQYKIVFCSTRSHFAVQDRILQCKDIDFGRDSAWSGLGLIGGGSSNQGWTAFVD